MTTISRLVRVLSKPHHEIENDPGVWDRVGALIDDELSSEIPPQRLHGDPALCPRNDARFELGSMPLGSTLRIEDIPGGLAAFATELRVHDCSSRCVPSTRVDNRRLRTPTAHISFLHIIFLSRLDEACPSRKLLKNQNCDNVFWSRMLRQRRREISEPGPPARGGSILWHTPKQTVHYPDTARSIPATTFPRGQPDFHGTRQGQG